MELWTDIRRRVLVEGESKRQILRETGMHWTTLEKILAHSRPPGYRRRQARDQPKIGAYRERIAAILEADKTAPRKQRHTAKRIFERIRDEGYAGGYTQVKEAVRRLRRVRREVFVPLIHRPGEAQVDFGHAWIEECGVERKVVYFVMALPYSDAMFVRVYDRECTEVYWDAHREAFAFFGGVPKRITYDNTSVLVKAIISAHDRELTDGFLQLQSHYLFEHHFCRVRRANEKGVVESMVKYGRRNYLVPVPRVRGLDELNAQLLERCREDLQRRIRGKEQIKAVRLREDQAAFLPLPTTEFDACRKVNSHCSSMSLVRFDGNDYSVPVRWAHHSVVVKGYVDQVVVCHKDQEIARHRRDWGKEGVIFDPVHYLALLERKPGALDYARPLEGWALPDCFDLLRRRQRHLWGRYADLEYIRVLRLLEHHSMKTVARAIERALSHGGLTRDLIAQYLDPPRDIRRSVFVLAGRPHLRHVRVAPNRVAGYGALLGGQA
jgi:transposase